MEEPDFWDVPEQSQEAMKTLKSLKDDVETYQQLKEQYEQMGISEMLSKIPIMARNGKFRI